MTQEDWKLLLPFVQAGADGKKLQIRFGELWIDLDPDCYFNTYVKWIKNGEFRIAPEPTIIPWDDDEVPLDAWYRIANHPNDWAKIERRFIEIPGKLVYYIPTELNRCADTQELLNLFEHSTDGCKTWKRCGKEVTQ